MISKKDKGIMLLEEVLKNLENPKFSLFNAIQKLNRAGKLLNESNLIIWSEIQLGNISYTLPSQDWIDKYFDDQQEKTKKSQQELNKATKRIEELGIKLSEIFSNEELTAKADESGGGFKNIGFIEERYNDFLKTKKGNDGTYYKSNLADTLSIIKSIAYKKASYYHKKYAYESLPETNFETLKERVENVLFDVNPELVEILMLAFKSVSSDKQEEWSQALTSCRRFFKKLADNLYPPTDDKINGRNLAKENYINRLWAYMDKSIESKSNKDIAKKHIDLIGAYLQSLYRITNKGVHANLNRFEALKTVMHIYLLCADLLNYLDKKQFFDTKPNIHNATLDEIESVGKVSRNIAKEIVKLRVKNKILSEELLKQIPGVGVKTLKNLLANVSIDPI